MPNSNNEFLRHILATVAYRFQKSLRKYSSEFGDFSLGNGTRTTTEIVYHIFRVLNATKLYILENNFKTDEPEELSLNLEIKRFNNELIELDKVLVNTEIDQNFAKRLLQGPFSDILTHIGQIAMMNRLNGNAIEGEDFSSAPVTTGKLKYF